MINCFFPLNTVFTILKLNSKEFLKLELFSRLRLKNSFTMAAEMPLIALKISVEGNTSLACL